MPLAIQQPFFFPYLDYYSLIHASSEWISFDTPQYVRKSWYNRNRVLKPDGTPQWITVPVQKHSQSTPFNEIKVASGHDLKEELLRKLWHYRKVAKNYDETISLAARAFSCPHPKLTSLNEHILATICDYLEIPFNPVRFSNFEKKPPLNTAANMWAVEICNQIGARSYVASSNSIGFLDPNEFAKRGIQLVFLRPSARTYQQGPFDFEAKLSILDVLMFNSRADCMKLVSDYKLVRSQGI
ncbi:WbqC family protein [Pelagicoccus mobilis]|uniref:WbqC family protein n=1 Tax=Pelagicoccus mobilis TaxID=415221 RepID=A0A934VKG0_9BACT|nr:WbqC family protein [Pelagicoccus mobilis]MBK1876636.1 WbqC family protein [Pelagicoccus mobilis]